MSLGQTKKTTPLTADKIMVEYTQKSFFLALFDELYGPEAGSQMQAEFVSRIAPTLGLSTKKLNAPISKAEYEFGLAKIERLLRRGWAPGKSLGPQNRKASR